MSDNSDILADLAKLADRVISAQKPSIPSKGTPRATRTVRRTRYGQDIAGIKADLAQRGWKPNKRLYGTKGANLKGWIETDK